MGTSLDKKIPLLKSFFCMFGELSGEEIAWIGGVHSFCLKKYGTSRNVLFCGVLSWVDKDVMKVKFFWLRMENRKLQGVVLRQVQSRVSYIQAKFHNIYFANANICFLSRSVQCKSLNPRNMFKEKNIYALLILTRLCNVCILKDIACYCDLETLIWECGRCI